MISLFSSIRAIVHSNMAITVTQTWWKELYKTSFSQIYNASISGGSQKTRYYVSLGANNQGGILKAVNEKYNK